MNDPRDKDREESELQTYNCAVYHVIHEDIKFAKGQQWKFVYYAVLSFVAIIGFSQALSAKLSHLCKEQLIGPLTILSVIALAVSGLAIWNILQTTSRLSLYRMMLLIVESKFPESARYSTQLLRIQTKPEREQLPERDNLRDEIIKYSALKRDVKGLIAPFLALIVVGNLLVVVYFFAGTSILYVVLLFVLLVNFYVAIRSYFHFRDEITKTRNKLLEKLKL